MSQTRLLGLWLVLGSVLMILAIIVYWDSVGTAYLYLHTSLSRPQPLEPRPSPGPGPGPAAEQVGEVSERRLGAGPGARTRARTGTGTGTGTRTPTRTEAPGGPEESVRGYDWERPARGAPRGAEAGAGAGAGAGGRQAERRAVLRGLCANGSFEFPSKGRAFDDIPSRELSHLIVDDRHGVIYCYVPKVACTNWKRVMIVLSGRPRAGGAPFRDPLDIPRELVHNASAHLTLDTFRRRYGRLSRRLVKLRLQKYTKFLFVRDPFVRLISAFRSKFELQNEDFYRRFAVPMLRRYSNHSSPPASVRDAFSAGLRVSFSHFVQYLLDPHTERRAPFNEHWRQVHRLCHPCQIDYDFVGKLETLEQDAAQLLRLLKVDKLLHFPPSYRNRTASSWEEDWFAQIPLAWRRQLYKLYEADFVLFGYPKPENLLRD